MPSKLKTVEEAPRQTPVGEVADDIIAGYGGDARVAVIELLAIVRHLSEEIRSLSVASSPGYARRPPRPASPK
jgi:hypothetical protein